MPYRLATLACALAAATQAAAQVGAPEPTTVDAQKIEGISDLEVTARGAAEIHSGDVIIFGDFLRYNREFGEVEGRDGVRMQAGPDRISGPGLQYNMLDDTGSLEQPKFLMQRERPARGTAERIEFLGRQKYHLFNTTFTTCQPGQDDWFVEAKELDLDYENDEGRATKPRVRFFDHTLFAFPYAEFPLENKRRSGVLHPYYATTSTRGLEIGVPYYWNIAPERDAMFTPVLMARRGFQLKSEARYLGAPYAGELRYEYLPNDPVFGASRSGLSWQHAQSFSPTTTGQVNYNKVSDDRYFADLSTQVRQLSVGNLPQEAFVTRENALPGDGVFVGEARVQRFQTLQDPNAPIIPPYQRLPQLTASARYSNMGGLFDGAVPAEFVRFAHNTLVEGSRASISPTLSLPQVTPGWYVTPKTGFRYTAYSFDRPMGSPDPSAASVTVPWFSLDSGLVFERNTSTFGEGMTQTFEPRLYYLYVPFRDQTRIPLFDTTLADFNFPQLFSENRFVGGDRFGDANQLTLAATTRYFLNNGQEAFRAMLGQRYYFANEKVALVPGVSQLRSANESDVLAAVGTRVQKWTFDVATQYDPGEDRFERYGVAARYAPERARILNASYRFQRETLRQIDLSGQWPVWAGWYGVGRYNYSLRDQRLLEGLFGAEYNAGCWIFRFVVQRIQATTRVSSSTFIMQLEFTGVGQVGTAEAVQLLRRDVPGYSVLNSVDPSAAPPSARPRLPFEQVY